MPCPAARDGRHGRRGPAADEEDPDRPQPLRRRGGARLHPRPGQGRLGGKTCGLSCSFQGAKVKSGSPTFANVLFEKQGAKVKAFLITISVGYVSGGGGATGPDFDTPLASWKTSKGIGLGSKVGAVEAAYPKAKKEPMPSGPLFVLAGPGESQTSFDTLENRVTSITVESHPAG